MEEFENDVLNLRDSYVNGESYICRNGRHKISATQLNHKNIIYPKCEDERCRNMLLHLNTYKKQNRRCIDSLCKECLSNYEISRSTFKLKNNKNKNITI